MYLLDFQCNLIQMIILAGSFFWSLMRSLSLLWPPVSSSPTDYHIFWRGRRVVIVCRIRSSCSYVSSASLQIISPHFNVRVSYLLIVAPTPYTSGTLLGVWNYEINFRFETLSLGISPVCVHVFLQLCVLLPNTFHPDSVLFTTPYLLSDILMQHLFISGIHLRSSCCHFHMIHKR